MKCEVFWTNFWHHLQKQNMKILNFISDKTNSQLKTKRASCLAVRPMTHLSCCSACRENSLNRYRKYFHWQEMMSHAEVSQLVVLLNRSWSAVSVTGNRQSAWWGWRGCCSSLCSLFWVKSFLFILLSSFSWCKCLSLGLFLMFPVLKHDKRMSDGVRMQQVSQVFLDLELLETFSSENETNSKSVGFFTSSCSPVWEEPELLHRWNFSSHICSFTTTEELRI